MKKGRSQKDGGGGWRKDVDRRGEEGEEIECREEGRERKKN